MGARLSGRDRQRRAVTVRDVAGLAGVSPSTVSRVLTGSRHPVSAEGRQRVLAAARRLGYIPNLLARSLLTHETAAIGVLIPDVSNPYYAAILRGIEDATSPTHRAMIICNTDRVPEKQHLHLRTLLERRVDGIVIAGGAIGRAEVAIIGGRIPMVIIGRHPVPVPSVRVDNIAAAAAATRHLLALGHRRIACLAGPAVSPTASDRVKGYLRALRSVAVPVDQALILEVGFGAAGVSHAVQRLFGTGLPPSAVLAPNDQVGIGVIRSLHDLGYRVPGDVSVVGFDDTPLASYTVPALTTVAIPMYEMGRTAGGLLLRLLEGKGASSVTLPHRLVVRESTAPPSWRAEVRGAKTHAVATQAVGRRG